MIDVFLRGAPKTLLRMYLAAAVWERWIEEKDIKAVPLWGKNSAGWGTLWSIKFAYLGTGAASAIALPEDDFAWGTRRYAEDHAEGDRYILADDDHMPLGSDWVKRLVESSDRHPDYAILGARSKVIGERPDPVENDSGVLRWWCVGTPCLIRKGTIPYSSLSGKASQQDIVIAEAMKDKKIGFVEGLDYLHLGFGHSQVEPLLWRRY